MLTPENQGIRIEKNDSLVSRLMTDNSLSVSEALLAFKNVVEASKTIVARELKSVLLEHFDELLQSQVPGNELANAMRLQEVAIRSRVALPDSLVERNSRRSEFFVNYSNNANFISLEIGHHTSPGALRLGFDIELNKARIDIIAGTDTAQLARAAGINSRVWNNAFNSKAVKLEEAIASHKEDSLTLY